MSASDYFDDDYDSAVQPVRAKAMPKTTGLKSQPNIAALLRTDARTVHVQFIDNVDTTRTISNETWTYVTNLDLKKGDVVIVSVKTGTPMVGLVHSVDDKVLIDPTSSIKYKWVIGKVDLDAHEANMDRNAKIETAAQEAARQHLRKSFANQVFAQLDDESASKLRELL